MWHIATMNLDANSMPDQRKKMVKSKRSFFASSLILVLTWNVMLGVAWGEAQVLLEDNFEGTAKWALSGDWRFKSESTCLPDVLGYVSPTTAMAFDFGNDCAYRNNREGYATLLDDVHIPITTPTATLVWSDFVGAEDGHDFYFVESSTDRRLDCSYGGSDSRIFPPLHFIIDNRIDSRSVSRIVSGLCNWSSCAPKRCCTTGGRPQGSFSVLFRSLLRGTACT